MKIGFIASSGGHFEQLMMLYPLMKKNDSFILTEQTTFDVNTKGIKKYNVLQVNRKELFFFIKILIVFFQSLKIFIKERPDVVLSTGALSTVPILLIAKLCKKKVVFIESFSKVNSATITGKVVYKFADLFIVQWEELIKYYPNAKFGGGIY